MRRSLRSTDQDWLQLTEPWARQAVEKFTPWWAWFASWRGFITMVLTAFFGGYAVLFGAQSVSIGGISALLLAAGVQLGGMAAYIAAITRPKVIIGASGAPRVRAFFSQAAILLIGALIGVLATRVFDVLFPVG